MRRYGKSLRGGRRLDGNEPFQTINITPFTDVLLVLLIIFLIAGSSLNPRGLAVDKLSGPGTLSQKESRDFKDQTLHLSASGELVLLQGAQRISNPDLKSLDKSLAVNLTADAETTVDQVVEIYDTLLEEGYQDVRLGEPQSLP